MMLVGVDVMVGVKVGRGDGVGVGTDRVKVVQAEIRKTETIRK